MPDNAFCRRMIVLIGLASATPAAAQTASPFVYTPSEDGFTFGIAGIDIAAAIAGALPGGTSASVVVTQSTLNNIVIEPATDRLVALDQSGRDNRGIVGINQEAGNLNSQANVRAIALVLDGQQIQTIDLQIAQISAGNTLTVAGGAREDRIADSFTNSAGITGINQSAGSLNQEANVLVLALGTTVGGDVMALGDATLSSVNSTNTLNQEGGGTRTDSLTNSFGNYRGIAQVAQSAGDLNTISNRMVISVTEVVR